MSSLPSQRLKILPHTEETYISFEYGCLRILDSYRFMGFPLDYLISQLKNEECKIFNSFPDVSMLNNKKGIYPYEYISGTSFNDIISIMQETQLPPKRKFYSRLRKKNITDKDYKLAQDNFRNLQCNNIYDYTMKYLKIDVCTY